MSVEDAARQIGVSVSCWRLWENGKRYPGADYKVKIFEWSLGHVTPNDFYDLPDLPPAKGGDVTADGARKNKGCVCSPHLAEGRPGGAKDDFLCSSSYEVLPGQTDMFPDESIEGIERRYSHAARALS